MNLVTIAVGGALGALLRFWVSHGVHSVLGRNYPYGTLTVNGQAWRSLLLVGLLGAFTTFSTFSLETLHLLEDGDIQKAIVNVVTNITFCIGAVWLGVVIGRAM